MDAVFYNLKRNGIKVTAIMDVDSGICSKYQDTEVKKTAREVAEATDVIITGRNYVNNTPGLLYAKVSDSDSLFKVFPSHRMSRQLLTGHTVSWRA